ncbi:diacylglycerol/lipid kinase family protein [Pontibacter beigongshangensis]|uniref:diacylglycerol/lipid kinase family protein n=1 Tax=Pontibacter beigongshangensis TaxID=2574733 RepID=UPI00164F460F|nr:diacylglycerol kinase family protein [Pontibacter beigongshangensis]
MDKAKEERFYIFVINPIAGDIEKEDLEEDIASICHEHLITYQIIKTTGQDDQQQIREQLEKRKPDAIFAVGGDGTVNLVASLIIGKQIPMGIIPLGSGNGLSKDLHIPQDTEAALQLIHTHQAVAIDTLDLNGYPSIHLSDLGFNALVVKRFCEGETRGPGSYAWIALQEYMSYEPKQYRIETDVENFEGPAFMVTIANANAFGSNASINPTGILNDGRFEICLIEPFPKAAGIGILYKLYTDSIDSSVFTRRISCRQATIYNLHGEVVHVDGEPVELGEKIQVSMHKESLLVLLPLPEAE